MTTTIARDEESSYPPTLEEQGGLEAKDVLLEIYWYIIEDLQIAQGDLTIRHVVEALAQEGIYFWRDLRFKESQNVALKMASCRSNERSNEAAGKVCEANQEAAMAVSLDYDSFCSFVCPRASLFLKVFSEELVIPDWNTFTTDMTYHFYEVEHVQRGQNAQYIPILAQTNPNQWGISFCSIDGQRFSLGDYTMPFSIQSVSKPVTYALDLQLEGDEAVEEWIGVEPAGRPFNTQDLDPETHRPYNASINTGAIMAAGIYASNFSDLSWMQLVDKVRETWYDLCGRDLEVGFSQETFDSEKATAYNNFAIAYNLKGRRGLPRDVDLHKMLDVYLGCCSIEMTAEALSVAAATLANGGICPITAKEVFPAHIVRHVLSETMTCGMYNQAGHFVVEVGLPAKSGVSGILMVVVPNVFGFATFSPRLNSNGNSVRGMEFSKRLVKSYRVHLFEPLRTGNTGAKVDPRSNGWKDEKVRISRIAWALQVHDVWAVRLRDIYLHVLVQAACATPEGLSDRLLTLIRNNYELVYQVPVEEALLQQVIASVKQHPSHDLSILQELVDKLEGVCIPDSMKRVIFLALVDIILIDGDVGQDEKNVSVDVAVLLGMDRDVVLMEIYRYEHLSDHRNKTVEPCNASSPLPSSWDSRGSLMIYNLREQVQDMSEELADNASEVVTKRKKLLTKKNLREASNKVEEKYSKNGEQDDVIALRRENLRLKRKIDKLTRMLHDARERPHRTSVLPSPPISLP